MPSPKPVTPRSLMTCWRRAWSSARRVFKPQQGKALASMYLAGAMVVLGPSLRYVHEWHDDASAVLEFEAELEGVYVQGVDMLRWNGDDKLGGSPF